MITSLADVVAIVADLRDGLPRLPVDKRRIASAALAELLLELDLDAPAVGEAAAS